MFSCATPGRNACTTKSLFLCAPRRFFARVGYALACHRRRAAKRHATSFAWLLGKLKHTPPAPKPAPSEDPCATSVPCFRRNRAVSQTTLSKRFQCAQQGGSSAARL